jgi:hypothetical protein
MVLFQPLPATSKSLPVLVMEAGVVLVGHGPA